MCGQGQNQLVPCVTGQQATKPLKVHHLDGSWKSQIWMGSYKHHTAVVESRGLDLVLTCNRQG